jgi:hypothetical protein
MNEIYQNAIDQQGEKGKPIFLANFRLSKSRFYGNAKTPSKSYVNVKQIVCAGKLGEIKADKSILYSCLVKVLGSKDSASKEDREKWKIEEVEIISFHGYSAEK